MTVLPATPATLNVVDDRVWIAAAPAGAGSVELVRAGDVALG